MTKREFMEMVIATVENEEMVEFAHHEIEKMNERNAKRAERPSKKSVENEPIKARIIEFVQGCDERVTASAIGSALELSTQKVSALCRQLVENGTLTSEEIKVKGKGKQKGYALA